ncbi:MAG: transcriptional regulator [Methanococci archaeon]|nr:transcriptional regulator [Methanococci archaeon]
MNIIKTTPEDFLNGLYFIPTFRGNILELDEKGEFEIINKIPIIRVVATPNLKKTVGRLIYLIKDKYFLFKNYENAKWLKNLLKYINEKIYFDKYYRAKKAWYRGIKDLFYDIKTWNFEKAIGKTITLLKILNPIIVFDIHDIRKWHYKKSFVRFVKELRKNKISVVIRFPYECYEEMKLLFPEGTLNVKASIKYFAKVHNCLVSDKVAEHLLKLTNGNLETIYLILKHSKREIKNLRELKIPWLKILPHIVNSKYRKLVEKIIELKKFKIEDIEYRVNYKLPTLYRYLDELVNLGILVKIRYKNKVRFKIKLNRNNLLNLLKNYQENYEHWTTIFLVDNIPTSILLKRNFDGG